MHGMLITKSYIDGAPGPKSVIHYDSKLKGFGLRVMPSGHMAWIVEYRPYGGGRSMQSRRMTLGSAATLDPDQARTEAKRLLAMVRLGADPAKDREHGRDMPTVSAFSKRFMDEHAKEKLKPRTVATYQDHFDRLINPVIGSIRIDRVTRSVVASMHRSIARTGRSGKRREG